MSASKQELQQLFFERLSVLSPEDIYDLSDSSKEGNINNVIARLSRQCSIVLIEEDGVTYHYRMIFVIYDSKLEGYCLDLSMQDTEMNKLIYLFSTFLSNSYQNLDPINIHNTFQSQLRSFLEKFGFFTYCASDIRGLENPTFLPLSHRGSVFIDFIERLNVYNEIFNHPLPVVAKGHCYTYLMLNLKNNFVKIGKSNNPKFREKTLQSEQPEIALLTFWKAPSATERELHRIFIDKRRRGEWFDLQLSDMRVIKKFMSEYELVP